MSFLCFRSGYLVSLATGSQLTTYTFYNQFEFVLPFSLPSLRHNFIFTYLFVTPKPLDLLSAPSEDHHLLDFSTKDQAHCLPPRRLYDCAIDLVPGSTLPSSKLYNSTAVQFLPWLSRHTCPAFTGNQPTRYILLGLPFCDRVSCLFYDLSGLLLLFRDRVCSCFLIVSFLCSR